MDPPRTLEDLLKIPTWGTAKDKEKGMQAIRITYITNTNLTQLSYRDYQQERDPEQTDSSQEDIP